MVHSSTQHFVEDAIGDQMVMQARIVSHLVAIAQQQRMTIESINNHLKDRSFSQSGLVLDPPHYELLRRIGRGAYGEVWLARSKATGALRAVFDKRALRLPFRSML